MITIINKYHKTPKPAKTVSVMRPSVLGNPYSHMENTKADFKVATRDEAVACFKPWLKKQMKTDGPVWKELKRLADIAKTEELGLLCCCKPLACHGEGIKDALEWIIANPNWAPGIAR